MRRIGLFLILCATIGLGFIAVVKMQENPLCPASDLDVTFEGEWAIGTPMPTPRSEIAAAALDGVIYVAGGFSSEGDLAPLSDAFEIYDIETDSWTAAAPLPMALHHTGLAAFDRKLYLAGGYISRDFMPTDLAWVYDPADETWSSIAPLPAANGAHGLVALGDYLYLVGGAPNGNALWRYDPAADVWTTDLAPMPTAREHLGVTVLDEQIYVVGERTSQNLDAVERYDPAADQWETLEPMPTARGGFSAAAVEGLIFAGGGEDFNAGGCTFNRAEGFDPATNTWARLPDMPTQRHGIASVGVAQRWYVIGGANGAGSATFNTTSDRIEIFTPAR